MKVVIIGGGQVGEHIASLLLNNDYSVKVIDNREHIVDKLKKELPSETVILGNGTDPNILEAAGINSADVVVSVTGADEVNLVASTIAKFEFGVSRVVARVNNPKNSWLYNIGMGVDVAVNQADLMAHIVIEEMDLKNMFTLMKLSLGGYSIVQIKVDEASKAVHKEVKALNIPSNSKLITIYRGEEVILPGGDTVINAGDSILALANSETQAEVNKIFSPR
ncbi:potassium channel family protein [Clostridium intestinale]|uniref:Trk system potassium uptake protein TrkA n=1 Tax=Clostridium intestinale DSM 6191 TaxID=1121320 RepID=A0A1M5YX46_9CLOT|nr:TrkA family potassium uptake protein [Clostridium intestinale]SHI16609.1 trk system potassium uptake protein TrkA [Clostridium intestinale DSM 6191]